MKETQKLEIGGWVVTNLIYETPRTKMWEATDKFVPSRCGFLTIAKDASDDLAKREIIEQIEILNALNGGGWPKLLEHGEYLGSIYMVIECYYGVSLERTLELMVRSQFSFTIEDCVYIGSEIAKALDQIHSIDPFPKAKPGPWLYLGLSPSRIVIPKLDEIIRISDTWSACTSAETPVKGIIHGYISPEWASGKALTQASDVYVLGIILWELLTGARLFFSTDQETLIRKHRENKVPDLRSFNPAIHKVLKEIVMSCLDTNPAYRPSAMKLHRLLKEFLYRINPEFSFFDFFKRIKSHGKTLTGEDA